MNDIEDRIRAYRPSGLPTDLRARILDGGSGSSAAPSRGLLEWVPAIAAAAAVLVFAFMAERAQADIASRTSDAAAQRAGLISALATTLGDSEAARVVAERIVAETEWDDHEASTLNPPEQAQ